MRETLLIFGIILLALILGCLGGPSEIAEEEPAIEGWEILRTPGAGPILVDDEHIWFGSFRWNKNTGEWDDFGEKLRQLSCGGIPMASDDRFVWLVRMDMICRYDKSNGDWAKFTELDGLVPRIKSVAVDEKYIWFGGEANISRFEKGTGSWDVFLMGISPERMRGTSYIGIGAIAFDNDIVWFGINKGAAKYNKTSGKWEELTYSKDSNTIAGTTTKIIVDGDLVWFATSGGLSRYNKTSDTWETFTRGVRPDKPTGPQERIVSLAIDEDTVWYSGENWNSVFGRDKRSGELIILPAINWDRDRSSDKWSFSNKWGTIGEITSIAIDGDYIYFTSGYGCYFESKRDPNKMYKISEDEKSENCQGGITRWKKEKWIRTIHPDDYDGDGVTDSEDNCPSTKNEDQLDTDNDGIGNICDT